MLRNQEKEISGTHYRIIELAAEEGRRTLIRLLRLLGPTMSELIRASGPGAKMSKEAVADAIKDICLRLDENEFEALIRPFLAKTEVMAEKGMIPLPTLNAFSGRYGTMLRWLMWCVEFNYADFFAELGITGPQG